MAIHYDPKIWGEDAAMFRPERWQQAPREKFAFIPFALGPRACTGREPLQQQGADCSAIL